MTTPHSTLQRRMVRIRVAAAVDPQGRWYVYGCGTADGTNHIANHDQLLETSDYDIIGPSEALYWLTAELPVPEPQEVAAATLPQEREGG